MNCTSLLEAKFLKFCANQIERTVTTYINTVEMFSLGKETRETIFFKLLTAENSALRNENNFQLYLMNGKVQVRIHCSVDAADIERYHRLMYALIQYCQHIYYNRKMTEINDNLKTVLAEVKAVNDQVKRLEVKYP